MPWSRGARRREKGMGGVGLIKLTPQIALTTTMKHNGQATSQTHSIRDNDFVIATNC